MKIFYAVSPQNKALCVDRTQTYHINLAYYDQQSRNDDFF